MTQGQARRALRILPYFLAGLFLASSCFSADKLTVYVSPKIGIASVATGALPVRVWVRVQDPEEYRCPGLVYEIRSAAQPLASPALSYASHESDCEPGEEWDPPLQRGYALGPGEWRLTVRFCASGVIRCSPGMSR